MEYFPKVEDIKKAALTIRQVSEVTPLAHSIRLSKQYGANIHLKREDLQRVRSYKIRGAFNKINSLSRDERKYGIVCASAGNHAQGVAFACKHLKIEVTIYMPAVTPKQKVEQTKMFGEEWVTVVLEGDTFDDSFNAAMSYCLQMNKSFIHPFDDPKVIEGQGTVGLELLDQTKL